MNPNIEEREDEQRGCGWRKEGGLYMVSKGRGVPCCKLPIILNICPTCGTGIKPSRGWTWINADHLFPKSPCADTAAEEKAALASGREWEIGWKPSCPAAQRMGRIGLLWVGAAFYKTTGEFVEEASRIGISRRINFIPKDFVCGETWVAFAHQKGLPAPCPLCTPGENVAKVAAGLEACESCHGKGTINFPTLFYLFKPEAIEYVCKGDETDQFIDNLIERGITPVHVKRKPTIGDDDLFKEDGGE